jgi:hypothetical protein
MASIAPGRAREDKEMGSKRLSKMKMHEAKTTFKLIVSCFLSLFFVNILSCGNSTDKSSHSADIKSVKTIGYNLSDPDKTIILPHILFEVSGITLIDSSSVACIQDENGIIFIFDLFKNEIKKQLHFHRDGDYEGVTRVDKTIYILRSDGVLFEILNYGSSDFTKKIFSTGIPAKDNEGLCYDQKNYRLLIAPKSNIGKGSEYDNIRVIYGFDLKSGTLMKEHVFDFDLSVIKRFASDNKAILPVKRKKKARVREPEIKFRPSAIGIHPITNKLFVLSGIEKMLFVFDMNGTIEYMEKLNPDIFNMPEGITFFKNGDMLISNEGQNKYPTLLRFNYNRN